jgi:hypothetical protein
VYLDFLGKNETKHQTIKYSAHSVNICLKMPTIEGTILLAKLQYLISRYLKQEVATIKTMEQCKKVTN